MLLSTDKKRAMIKGNHLKAKTIVLSFFCFFLACSNEIPEQQHETVGNSQADESPKMDFQESRIIDTINLTESDGYSKAISYLDSICEKIRYSSSSKYPSLIGIERGIISDKTGIFPEYISRPEFSKELDSLSAVSSRYRSTYRPIYFEINIENSEDILLPEVSFSHFFNGWLHAEVTLFDQCFPEEERVNTLLFLFDEKNNIETIIKSYVHYD